MCVEFPEDDHCLIETAAGEVRIRAICFQGELYIKERLVPLAVVSEYRHLQTEQPISQFAAFATQEIHGINFSMEMHRIEESGETHVILRRLF